MPKNITARPTTDFARENIFNVLENMLDFDGLRALDLFAGTGAVSIELLSRGCGSVTAVEKSNIQYNFIRKVAQELGEKNLTLIKGDVFKFVAACRTQFDFIFAAIRLASIWRDPRAGAQLGHAAPRFGVHY